MKIGLLRDTMYSFNTLCISLIWLFVLACIPVLSSFHGAQASTPEAAGIDYDIVYVRYPRYGDTEALELPDGESPYAIEVGADLVLLHPNGSETILVDCRDEARGEDLSEGEANCSVQDPVVSYDGKWVYYAKYVDMGIFDGPARELNAHSFIFKMALDASVGEVGEEIQLTNLGDGFAIDKAGLSELTDSIDNFGIRDLGPAPLPDGRLVFTSNREAIVAFRQGTKNSVNAISASTVSQLYVVDDHDGSTPNINLKLTGHSILHQAQHPTVLQDGRVLFTNWDDAALRAGYATATLYTDHPDGGHLEQFLEPHHFQKRVEHFVTQLASGDVVTANYYPKMASWGFGTLLRAPVEIEGPAFISGLTQWRYFSRVGTEDMTPHSSGAHPGPADLSGRYSTPSAAPENSMLVAHSSGPVSFKPPCKCPEYPRVDSGIYLIENADTASITDPSTQIALLKNDPDYNEIWPRAVVPYQTIHGIERPAITIPRGEYEPTDRNRGLEVGTPIAITGTSSMQNRESAPLGRDRFNSSHAKDGGDRDKGWVVQGADAGLVANDDLWGVRILVMTPDRYLNPWGVSAVEEEAGLKNGGRVDRRVKGYFTHTAENWKILGEFPVRNSEGLEDPDSEMDTSWLAKIPANTPHLIQSIDRYGMTLSTEQTWRHVAPGKTFAGCGGCHAHSIEGIEFTDKWADRAEYEPWDLVNTTPALSFDDEGNSQVVEKTEAGVWGVEFRRDIYPILKRECAACHTSANNAPPTSSRGDSRVAIFDSEITDPFLSEVRAYRALARDTDHTFAHGYDRFPANRPYYYSPQRSRYIRAIQARASYLTWKLYDARMDGRTNEELPGDLDIKHEDIDYISAGCEASVVLTADEKALITRWIDLGAPFDLDRPRNRYTDDALVPTLVAAVEEINNSKLQLRIGAIDMESGIDMERSEAIVTPNGGSPIVVPFSDITFDAKSHVGLFPLGIDAAQVATETPLTLVVKAYDNAGNYQKVDRTLSMLDYQAGNLKFSVASMAASESAGTIVLNVYRNGGSAGAVEVDYSLSGGDASLDDDYQFTSGTLSWADGETGSKQISLTILDDAIDEDDESIVVALSRATHGAVLGDIASISVSITDNDSAGTLQFTQATAHVIENVGQVKLDVSRVDGSSGAVSVDYMVTGGTASVGEDYQNASGTLNWENGDITDKSIILTVVDNNLQEVNETIQVSLSDPSNNAVLGTQSYLVVTIEDEDATGVVAFVESAVSIEEDAGVVPLVVTRSEGTDGPISLEYSITVDGATPNQDFVLSAGTLNWADGEGANKVIELNILDDSDIEETEKIIVTLTNSVQWGVIGNPSVLEISILSDDVNTSLDEEGNTVSDSEKESGGGSVSFIFLFALMLCAHLIIRFKRSTNK